jgi:hypothetical protein
MVKKVNNDGLQERYGKCASSKTQKRFNHLTDRLYFNSWVVYAKEPIKQGEYVL